MIRTACLLLSALCATSALAGDFAVVVPMTYGNFVYDDADGKTNNKSTAYPEIGIEYRISKRDKIYSAFSFFDYQVDATRSGDIGAYVDASQFSIAWLHRLPVSRHFKPWLGLGLKSNMIDASNKHRIDSEGFLVQTFGDDENTVVALNLTANNDWRIGRSDWYIDTRIAYDVPIGDGIQSFTLGGGLKYEF